MSIFTISKTPAIPQDKKPLIEKYFFHENIKRCKLFASIVALFEVLLIVMNLQNAVVGSQGTKVLNHYLLLYILLLSYSVFMVVYIHAYQKKANPTEKQRKRLEYTLIGYIQFFLLWGAVLTLFDQWEYGQVLGFCFAFMISLLFLVSSPTLLVLYITPIVVLYVGLPFVQPSQAILVGHYINITVFLTFCWFTSRILYNNNALAHLNEILLMESNKHLEAKIEENVKINKQLENLNQQLSKLTVLDELTNIPNRRGFHQYICGNLPRNHEKRALSIMMIDVDDFKLFNDHYGHLEGDRVLQTVAQKLQDCLIDIPTGMAARFGGEEFVVALFDLEEDQVYRKAEDIRRAVLKARILHEYSSYGCATISIGLASGYVSEEREAKELIKLADQALYRSKSIGKNRVEVLEVVQEI